MGMERYRPKTKGVDGVSDAIATKIKNDAYDKEYAAMMKEYNKRVKAQNFEDKSMLGRGNKTISDADRAKLARMMGKEMGGKVQKMNMGGEMQYMDGGQVMDTTKSMPVGMMDGGKVKKMNMGGVISGRGGKFKGMK